MFAAANNLPLSIKNGSNQDGYKPEDFNSISDYYQKVALTTGASDLCTYDNVVQLNDYNSAQVGDLILVYNDEGRAHHTQVITKVTENNIFVAQGNFESFWPRMRDYLLDPKNTDDPYSIGYKGANIQLGIYFKIDGDYYNTTLGEMYPKYLFNSQLGFYKWNFYGFNP